MRVQAKDEVNAMQESIKAGSVGASARVPALCASMLAGDGRDLNKYLSVTVHGETYGIQVLKIREIIEYAEETELPMMPAFVRGAINLRGAGVPVIDLARRLGGKGTTVGRRSCIVIVEAPAGYDVGLLVDAVNEVVDIGPGDIEAAPNFGGKLKNDFLHGMGKVKGRFVKLLEVDRVLDPDELGPVVQNGTSELIDENRQSA